MKIVYCIAGTCHSGGMERVLANKANWLARHGHEVIIVTTDQREEKAFFPLDSSIDCYDLAIGYEDNNGKGLLNKLAHYPFKQLRHRKKLKELLMRLKADVVVSMFCNDASFLPSIKDGSRKVLEIHFSRHKLLQYNRKGLWAIVDRLRSRNYESIARRYERFVVLTEEDAGYWRHLHNMMVIPNARTFVCDVPAELSSKVVIAVGRYTYQKGYDRLIAAWAMVHGEMPDWTLHIVGDGELRRELEQQIAAEGLQDCVRLGKASHEMKDVYLGASVMALSSHYEGLPMVLLEAQAAGLPIVSFDCQCGPKDLIRHGENGLLIKEGDIRALADGLITIMRDESLRKQMGAAAYRDSERYDSERIMRLWEDMFRQL